VRNLGRFHRVACDLGRKENPRKNLLGPQTRATWRGDGIEALVFFFCQGLAYSRLLSVDMISKGLGFSYEGWA